MMDLPVTDRFLSADATAAFGPDFLWGVATSAYQIEGAAQTDGRAPSIWDRFSHTPGKTEGGDTGDVACAHYQHMPADVALIEALGVQAYRFSMSWSRVQPEGKGAWNEKGLAFYDALVDQLLARGVQPHLTLYHWDLPQALQDQGGWGRRDTALHFADYAERIGRRLGDRLASISTHNEPWCAAVLGHLDGKHAPGLRDPELAVQVSHHLLLSHGLALRAMRAAGVKSPLGIVLNQSPAQAATDSEADQALARSEYTKFVRWYLEPLLLGAYPQDPAIIHAPNMTADDLRIISAPLDFLGINYYNRMWVSAAEPPVPAPCPFGITDMGWEIYPQGLCDLLVGLHQRYKLPPIYIMENGLASVDTLSGGAVHDEGRIQFIRRHLEALAEAKQAGVDVRGYFHWSLMDNFEWDRGYGKRFGLIHVDYETQVRTLKDSAHWYRQMIQQVRGLRRGRN